MHILSVDRNKSPLKISGKVAVGVVRDSRIFFRAPVLRAHRAVIFAIAKFSLLGEAKHNFRGRLGSCPSLSRGCVPSEVSKSLSTLSQKSETAAEKRDSRRISPLSRRFRRQSHFSATVWTGLKTLGCMLCFS